MKLPVLFAALLACGLPGAAMAHPGHDMAGFAAGFAHPFTGIDHLLAMLALGVWAAQYAGRPRYALPLGFVAAMLAGAFLGMAGMGVPATALESLIAASVLCLGLLIALKLRLPVALSLAIAGGFGLFHGLAHGMEMGSSGLAFVPGFVAASLLLHGLGMLLGHLISGRRLLVPATGVPIAVAGAAFVLQVVAG